VDVVKTSTSIDVPSALLELLYLRELWDLAVANDIPPIQTPPPRTGRPRPVETLASEWTRLWDDAISALSSGETPTSWALVHGTDGTDRAAMEKWRAEHNARITRATIEAVTRRRSTPEQLVGPTARTVQDVFILPLVGDYGLRISDSAVLVSESTRQDPAKYAAALTRTR
jgi:hypothetical protein